MNRQETYLSQYNDDPAVTAALNLPASVIVNEVTLREGEEGAESAFSTEEKIEFALLLDAAGIPQIEIGYAGNSAADRQVITNLKVGGLRAKIQTLVQAYLDNWAEQCDLALDCGADWIGLLVPASKMRLERVHQLTQQQTLDKTAQIVDYVARRGGQIAFIPFDTTRADLGFLRDLARIAAAAGASRIVLTDTVGGAMPAAIRYLVGEVVKVAPLAVQMHCHNDFGLGLANTLAALEAGASILDASVNGLGERAGNTSLDELAVVLQVMYGIGTGIDLSQMVALSCHAERLSGIALSLAKPLVGKNAFAHKLDSRWRAVQDYAPLLEIIPPELVGNRRTACLSGHAGRLIVRAKLDEAGLTASDAQVEQLVAGVRAKAAGSRARLDDTAFMELYRAIVGKGD